MCVLVLSVEHHSWTHPSQITMLEALLREGKKERCMQEVELVVAAAKQITGEVRPYNCL